MQEILKQISEIPCVNGSEFRLSEYLKEHFDKKGFFVEVDQGRNLLIQKSKNTDPEYVLFTPMDSPGYLCLYKEGDCAYLTETSSNLKGLEAVEHVKDFRGKIHKLKKEKNRSDFLYIKSKNTTVGSAFALSGDFFIDDRYAIGWNSARYTCIATTVKLIEALENPKIAVCFTAGFNSGSKAESNVLTRTQNAKAILLGFCEEKSDLPILLIKDGKHFASPSMNKDFMDFCHSNDFCFLSKVSNKAVTAAERTISRKGNIISLALPCTSALSEKEATSLHAAKELFSFFKTFFK